MAHLVQFFGYQAVLLQDNTARLHGFLQERMLGAVIVLQGLHQFHGLLFCRIRKHPAPAHRPQQAVFRFLDFAPVYALGGRAHHSFFA